MSLMITPLFIKFQRNKKIGKRIRIDGPKTHSVKSGTPTMGGLVFVFSSLVSYAIVSLIQYYRHGDYSIEGVFAVSILLLCSFIGFIDDYIAIKKQGLSSLHRKSFLKGIKTWLKNQNRLI